MLNPILEHDRDNIELKIYSIGQNVVIKVEHIFYIASCSSVILYYYSYVTRMVCDYADVLLNANENTYHTIIYYFK